MSTEFKMSTGIRVVRFFNNRKYRWTVIREPDSVTLTAEQIIELFSTLPLDVRQEYMAKVRLTED